MTTSVSLSTRVSPELRERLLAVARARKVPLSTLARDLLAAGANGKEPSGDGGLVNEVECVFTHLPMDAGVYREVCLALARTAEGGGSAGVTAGRELLETVAVAQRLFVPEEDEEDEEPA
jgi:hypothetical protein